MKKIFTLCLAGALALAATACDDKDDKGGGDSGKMTINGRTEPVKSALFQEYPAEENDEAEFDLYLLREVYTSVPDHDPDFSVNIEVSESLNGKTLDLTKPLDQSGTSIPYLYIAAIADGTEFEIEYYNGQIGATDNATVTSGTLTATRNGNKFTVKLSVTLSDGNSIRADWKGTATKIEFSE